MSDGKALQMGTSHNLGQHFAKVFDIRFEDRSQNLQYVWQTSWGVSTRLIGALIMAHGDDSGLVFPPRVAPFQVVIVPISMGNWKETVLPVVKAVEKELDEAGVRVKLDAREEFTPGWKFSEWEMRGVPLRLEIGPRDIKENKVVFVRRDNQTKEAVPLTEILPKVREALQSIQDSLFAKALKFREENTFEARDYGDFKKTIETKRGFLKALWCGDSACEEKIKEETMATVRVVPLDQDKEHLEGSCVCCGKDAQALAFFARAY